MSELTPDQEKALDDLAEFIATPHVQEFVFEGYAGVGKTYTIDALFEKLTDMARLHALVAKDSDCPYTFDDILMTATTHKACDALRKSVEGKIEVQTIYTAAGLVMRPNGRGKLQIQRVGRWEPDDGYYLVIIDEASYLNAYTHKTVRDRFPNSKIVLMGDPAQLLPADEEPANVFDVDVVPLKTTLTKVMRNKGAITTISAGYRDAVTTGLFPYLPELINDDTVEWVDGPEFQALMDAEFSRKDWTPDDSRVISWKNATCQAYNNYIGALRGDSLIPKAGDFLVCNSTVITPSNEMVCGTDSVVKIKEAKPHHHRLGIFGYLVRINNSVVFAPSDFDEARQLKNRLYRSGDRQDYIEAAYQWADLRLPYAGTVHKAQGSTYDKVFVNIGELGECLEPETFARLMYVATSRPKTKLYLYGALPYYYGGHHARQSTKAAVSHASR
jgi:exodeoxyribonuclease-5